MLDRLWAGWRRTYVMKASAPAPEGADDDSCVFCAIFSSSLSDEESYVVWHGRDVVVMCNAFPYASGHLMVMPKRHVACLEGLTEAESQEMWELLQEAVAVLRVAYRPEGINVGANLGRAAGAGIPDHLHFHALPRWVGDTNFMTAVAETRVLPESLGESWRRLREVWEERRSEPKGR